MRRAQFPEPGIGITGAFIAVSLLLLKNLEDRCGTTAPACLPIAVS